MDKWLIRTAVEEDCEEIMRLIKVMIATEARLMMYIITLCTLEVNAVVTC